MLARWHAAAFITRRLFVMMLVTASVVTLYSAVASSIDGSSGAAKYTLSTGAPGKTVVQPKPSGISQGNDIPGVQGTVPATENAGSPADPSTASSPREYVRPDDGPTVASTRPDNVAQPPQPAVPANPPNSNNSTNSGNPAATPGSVPGTSSNGASSTSGSTEPANATVYPTFSISAKASSATGNRDNVVRVVDQDQLAFDFGSLQPGSRYIWVDIFSVQNLTAVPLNFTVSSSGNASLWFSTDGGSRWSLRSTSPTTTGAMDQLKVSIQVEVPTGAAGGEAKADVIVSATQKGVN